MADRTTFSIFNDRKFQIIAGIIAGISIVASLLSALFIVNQLNLSFTPEILSSYGAVDEIFNIPLKILSGGAWILLFYTIIMKMEQTSHQISNQEIQLEQHQKQINKADLKNKVDIAIEQIVLWQNKFENLEETLKAPHPFYFPIIINNLGIGQSAIFEMNLSGKSTEVFRDVDIKDKIAEVPWICTLDYVISYYSFFDKKPNFQQENSCDFEHIQNEFKNFKDSNRVFFVKLAYLLSSLLRLYKDVCALDSDRYEYIRTQLIVNRSQWQLIIKIGILHPSYTDEFNELLERVTTKNDDLQRLHLDKI